MAVSMATAAVAATLGFGAMTAVTQIAAGRQESKAIKGAGEFNALVYEQQASMVQEQKKLEEYQYNRQISRMRGAVTARTAGAGLNLSGSPLAILIDNETQMKFDQAIGQYNLEVQRKFALSGAVYQRTTADEQARLARFKGYTNAFSTILGAGASAYSFRAGKL